MHVVVRCVVVPSWLINRMTQRILFVSNCYPPNFIGGAELTAHYHAKAMHDAGHEVMVFAGYMCFEGKRFDHHEDEIDGLPVYRMHLREEDFIHGSQNFFHAEVERDFRQVLERFRPDVVHFHNINGLSLGLPTVAKRFGAKTIMTLHDHWAFCLKATLIDWTGRVCQDFSRCVNCLPGVDVNASLRIPLQLRQDYYALCLRNVDFFIAPSRYMAGAYIRSGIPPEKMRRSSYGTTLERLSHVKRQPSGGPIRFTFIGYIGEHKGVRVLVEAAALLKKPERAQVNLVGIGPLTPELEKYAKEHGIADVMRFVGRIGHAQIPDILSHTDVLILPSIWPENQPCTISEALAAGISVIGSRTGGIPEMVDDGATGFLFETASPADLAAKMQHYIDHPQLVDQMGDRARRRAVESFESQAQELLEIYGSPVVPSPPEPTLVLCAGKRMEPDCAAALELLNGSVQAPHGTRVVLQDWMSEPDLSRAAVLWVTDHTTGPDDIRAALRRGTSLLVDEANRELTRWVRTHDCGLFYRNPIEAAACLRLLTEKVGVRDALGANARRSVDPTAAPAPAEALANPGEIDQWLEQFEQSIAVDAPDTAAAVAPGPVPGTPAARFNLAATPVASPRSIYGRGKRIYYKALQPLIPGKVHRAAVQWVHKIKDRNKPSGW
jgi:glycosyltransferase involved in cell wall biosynthesis